MTVKRTVGMEHTLVVGTTVHPLRSSLTSWSNLSQALHLPYISTGSSQKNVIAHVLSEEEHGSHGGNIRHLRMGVSASHYTAIPPEKASSGPMNDRVGALFSWGSGPEPQVRSRVGISFISPDKARSYIRSEIPSWDLNDTVQSAVEEWNNDVFRKIQVPLDDTANLTNVRLLYSSLYFIHLMPSDRTGETPSGSRMSHPGMTSTRFVSIFSLMFLSSADMYPRGHISLHGQLLPYLPAHLL